MKKIILLSCSLCLYFANAQNITFTDSLLKGALIDSPAVGYSTSFIDLNGNVSTNVDTDNDGEISISEAENIINIDFYYLPFTDLEGLQYFTNLKTISSLNSYANSFNFPQLTNLEELILGGASGQQTLSNFDVSNNLNLKVLELNTGFTSTVDLSNNINLRELRISDTSTNLNLILDNLVNLRKLSYYGSLPTLNISDCIRLIEIGIGFTTAQNIGLSSINLTNQPLLVNLNISNTNITTLDLSANLNLENVYVQGNQLQTINFGSLYYVRNLYCENNQITSLDLNNFQNLEILSCSNNNLTELKLKNFKIEQYIDFNGNPNLAYVCCDPEQEVYIQNQALLYGNYDTVVNSECSSNGVFATETVEDFKNKMVLFPNPASDYLNISSAATIESVVIIDVNGRVIKTIYRDANKIDVSNLQNGIYFMKVKTNNSYETMKFIKE
ncbi:MAG: T9SS type A sorting domain-containing protein [Flavobacterium sp.]|nr:T9SS type A sorting domain-containing protein [Flavobacterium sp.]